jgi:hypothetical protein
MPPNTVYVGRPTKWGNPVLLPPNPSRIDYQSAVETYEGKLLRGELPVTVEDARSELAGKNLACWCPLTDGQGHPVPCHADVLLRLANE